MPYLHPPPDNRMSSCIFVHLRDNVDRAPLCVAQGHCEPPAPQAAAIAVVQATVRFVDRHRCSGDSTAGILRSVSEAAGMSILRLIHVCRSLVVWQQLPSTSLKTTVAVLGAASLLLSVPSLVITTPQLPLPLSIRRATNFPLSKVLVYILIIILSVLPMSITRVGSDLVLLLAFASTYMVPALLHIITHNFRRPLSIVIPPTTPTMSSELTPSDSANDELLQRKEHMLQRRRLGRRLVWDIGVWVLLVPVGGGGLVWAVGRMADKW